MEIIQNRPAKRNFSWIVILLSVFILLFILGKSTSWTTLAATPSPTHPEQDFILRDPSLKAPAGDVNPTQIMTTTLFSDDFSGDLSQWTIDGGNWYIDQGELVGQGINLGAGISAGDSSWTNFSYQVKVIFINNQEVRLRYRIQTTRDYLLEVYPQSEGNNGTYMFGKYVNGIFYVLKEKISPVPITNPSVFKFDVDNDHVLLYINGQYIDKVDDPDLIYSGKIGLNLQFEDSARFDNVIVSSLPPVMITPPAQSKFFPAGSRATYTLELENHTGTADSFTIAVLPGHSWTTNLSTSQVGPIEDGETYTFTATVDIPSEAHPGDFDIATIQATSVISPEQYIGLSTITTKNASIAYVVSDGQLVLVDRLTHSVIDMINLGNYGCGGPEYAKITPDGTRLFISCTNSGNLVVFDTTTNSYLATIQPPERFYDFDFTQDGSHALLEVNEMYTYGVRVMDIDAYTFSDLIVTNTRPGRFAIHPAKPLAYVIENTPYDSNIAVIDTTNFTILTHIYIDHTLVDLYTSPDGAYLYASGSFVNIINTKTNQVIDEFNTPYLNKMEMVDDGHKLYTVEGYSNSIFAYRMRNFQLVKEIILPGQAYEIELDCLHNELYASAGGFNLPVIDTITDEVIANIPMPGYVQSIAICPEYISNVFMEKTTYPEHQSQGGLVYYTISTKNISSTEMNQIAVTDTVPATMNYVEGSLYADSGSWDYQDGVVHWTGSVPANTEVDIHFLMTVPMTTPIGTKILNTALIQNPAGKYVRNAELIVDSNLTFFPCAIKPCGLAFFDDFSDPTSGWPIESGADYTMGYYNNTEYRMTINPGWIAWGLQDFGVSDYRVSVKTWPKGNKDGAAGLIFSLNNDGFYLLLINDGWFTLVRNDSANWTWVPLIDWSYSPYVHPGLQANTIEVLRVGTEIEISANGHFLGRAYDGTYRGTSIGMALEAWSVPFDVRFDNFTLYSGVCIGRKSTSMNTIRASEFEAIWLGPDRSLSGK